MKQVTKPKEVKDVRLRNQYSDKLKKRIMGLIAEENEINTQWLVKITYLVYKWQWILGCPSGLAPVLQTFNFLACHFVTWVAVTGRVFDWVPARYAV